MSSGGIRRRSIDGLAQVFRAFLDEKKCKYRGSDSDASNHLPRLPPIPTIGRQNLIDERCEKKSSDSRCSQRNGHGPTAVTIKPAGHRDGDRNNGGAADSGGDDDAEAQPLVPGLGGK